VWLNGLEWGSNYPRKPILGKSQAVMLNINRDVKMLTAQLAKLHRFRQLINDLSDLEMKCLRRATRAKAAKIPGRRKRTSE